MSWQRYEPEMTFEEKQRIIAKARAAIAKAKLAIAEVNRARIEELREMQKRNERERR